MPTTRTKTYSLEPPHKHKRKEQPSPSVAILNVLSLWMAFVSIVCVGAVAFSPPAPPPPPPPQVVHQRRRDYAEPVFRSLGAGGGDSEDEEPGFTACGADDAQPADAPAEATTTDAAVDALCDPMKNMATDRDFMKKVMGTLDTLPEPEAIMGAKLAMPNLQASCLFADNIHPKERGGDVKGPEESAYKARANFNSSSDALINLLTSYGQSIPTTRFTVFGCFARWEKGVLTGLMSGSRDPSKLMHEVASKLRPLQAA